ncbi:hypothetical protein QEV13_08720 [Trueperella pyogenes]|uniref:hypothetical protein n=1 Tax=Trueperella pyogenes TaxID=1661 RepID=UPI0024C0AAF0|nr:hypothetical protein [Trueperella pyogenes]WHU62156.1 hypothetical protein QEV13_08720 [Trueperella pyogenes]
MSIGKNKLTPNADFIADYAACLRAVADVADYVAIIANARAGLHSAKAGEAGGLSGAPLKKRSLEVVRHVAAPLTWWPLTES